MKAFFIKAEQGAPHRQGRERASCSEELGARNHHGDGGLWKGCGMKRSKSHRQSSFTAPDKHFKNEEREFPSWLSRNKSD